MSVALLDINVLIALFVPGHVHHEAAHDWFADNAAAGWATCSVTETGFVRVLSNPAISEGTLRPATVGEHLRKFCASPLHTFWTDALSVTDRTVFDLSAASYRSITDLYLLALARTNRGRLVTFDRNIPVKAVIGARREHLEVIAPAAD